MRKEEHTINLDPEYLQVFEPGVSVHLYGGAIGVLPGINLAEKRAYGARLVGGLIDALIDLGKRGIIFESFTARSTKPDSIKLLRNLGFTQIPPVTEKKDIVLNVEMSGAREVMQYKLALKEYELKANRQEEKVDSKTDSKTGGKPQITVDIGGQSGTKRKTPNRFTSRSTKVQ